MNKLRFDRKQAQKDILAGITAGVVALPLALAFGAASGLGAAAGLYGAIGLGLFAAIFGGTPSQISGPTGPMTVVSATVITSFSGKPGIIFSVFLLAGLLQILFGFLRIGHYVKYIPYSVVSGFMSGIGVIIILLQINPLLGLPSSASVVEGLFKLLHVIPQTNITAFLLACLTIGIVYTLPKITKQIPATLVALIIGTLVSTICSLDVPTIGQIPAGLPRVTIPVFSMDFSNVIFIPALTLAALGTIDSLLTAVVADKLTREKHQSNKELVGQGIGNAISALIGGLPGAGATMRTVVNINAGGRTRVSGVVHALVLLSILLGLGPLASRIPMAVLAGILITVGIGIIDYKSFKDMRILPRTDTLVILVVLCVTVFVDLLQAVGIGIVLASLLFVKRMGDISTSFGRENVLCISWNSSSTILIKRLTGPLFFGFSNTFEEIVSQQTKKRNIKALILDMREVPYIDQSGLYAIQEISNNLQRSNTYLFLLTQKEQPQRLLTSANVMSEYIHFSSSIEEVISLLRNNLGQEEEAGVISKLNLKSWETKSV